LEISTAFTTAAGVTAAGVTVAGVTVAAAPGVELDTGAGVAAVEPHAARAVDTMSIRATADSRRRWVITVSPDVSEDVLLDDAEDATLGMRRRGRRRAESTSVAAGAPASMPNAGLFVGKAVG
jgi:hypothetical protein